MNLMFRIRYFRIGVLCCLFLRPVLAWAEDEKPVVG